MAHPDDAEILIGGTLFYLKSLGWELGIMTMTGGDCGSATHTSEEISRIRQAEAKAAADYLGAWYGCAGLMDVEIFANAENLRRVVELMRRFDPDVVITHSPADYMVDEERRRGWRGAPASRSRCRSTRRARTRPRRRRNRRPPCITPTPSTVLTRWASASLPHFYIDITGTLEKSSKC